MKSSMVSARPEEEAIASKRLLFYVILFYFSYVILART